ncbi:hypothetical protein [Streptomyces sp. B6B3]|uniref:hypothetical protein n=1 Tax=Streptomyces sp. B6B3 TaxID=3153570 RepID=UPI00325CD713
MQPVVLDTDVASLIHKGKLPGSLAARLVGRRPLITFVTFGGLTQWTELRAWGGRRRQELADWLSGMPVLPADDAVASTWGKLAAAATLVPTKEVAGRAAVAGGGLCWSTRRTGPRAGSSS